MPMWGWERQLNLILQVHLWSDTWKGVHYYLTSEDYTCHSLLATIKTHRFCLLVRLKSENWRGNYHWTRYSCVYAFVFCDIYTEMLTVYVAMLQDYLLLLPWFKNIGQFPFLLYAARIFPDRNMESTVERKLSLGTFLWSYGRFSVICGQLCEGNITHNVYFKGSYQIFPNCPRYSYVHSQYFIAQT
jgi:hypothetical protein